jgi:hypothetical protein
MKITQAQIKYYGTLAATIFVLMLSADHIASALNVVEKSAYRSELFFTGVWFAAAGLQVFEVLTAVGVADLLTRRKKSNAVLGFLIGILIFFFLINLSGNMLYAITNMADKTGREMTWDIVKGLDALKIAWVLWAAIPIPLMGLAGVTVQAIFRKDLDVKPIKAIFRKDLDVKPIKEKLDAPDIVKWKGKAVDYPGEHGVDWKPEPRPVSEPEPYDPDQPEKQSQPGG